MLNTTTQTTETNQDLMSGEYLKDIRTELSLTQERMANLLGYAYQKEMSRLEKSEELPSQIVATLKIIEVNLEAVKHQIRMGIL